MFKIQLSNPKHFDFRNEQDENIEEAIESVFPADTEMAFMIWDKIYIPVSYKYDVSVMIKDFMKISSFLRNDQQEALEIHWASNTFSGTWHLSKEANEVKINAAWNSVLGKLRAVLNANNKIVIDRKDFDLELVRMMGFIKSVLSKAGYKRENLNDYGLLEDLLK